MGTAGEAFHGARAVASAICLKSNTILFEWYHKFKRKTVAVWRRAESSHSESCSPRGMDAGASAAERTTQGAVIHIFDANICSHMGLVQKRRLPFWPFAFVKARGCGQRLQLGAQLRRHGARQQTRLKQMSDYSCCSVFVASGRRMRVWHGCWRHDSQCRDFANVEWQSDTPPVLLSTCSLNCGSWPIVALRHGPRRATVSGMARL